MEPDLSEHTEPPVRIYLAGSVAIERGDVLVSSDRFPGRQGRLAFALLAVERERAVGREELADVLWDGRPPPAWEVAVRALVSKLRSTLAPVGLDGGSIAHAFECYQLRLPPGAWVDVDVADDAAHRAEASLATGDVDGATGWALAANAIARRPFLPGEDGAWVQMRRARLLDVRVRALECRSQTHLPASPALAARDAELALQLAPFRETAHRLLMRAHVAAGNPPEALRAYGRCRSLLRDELGTDPSPETEALYLEILGPS